MAGRIHPPDGPRTRPPSDAGSGATVGYGAERKVYEALARGLPDGWVAWHGLRLRAGRRSDGEADFVIADPRRGLLVVEVKGGAVTQSHGRWYYAAGRTMGRPPLDQAHRVARMLQQEIDRVAGRDLRIPFAVAAWFPDTGGDVLPTNSDLRDRVLLERDLADPVPGLDRAFEAGIVPGNAPRDSGWIEIVTDLWGRDFEARANVLARIAHLDRLRERMNEQQLDALRGLSANPRVLVTGGAGTGKTTVARAFAVERAYQGQEVLFLCFTDPLARWLDAGFADLRAQGWSIRATTIRRLALEIAGDGAPPPSDHDGWMQVLARAVERASPAAVPADALLVDELQCFDAPDLALLERIAGTDRFLWAFWDPKQAFWERPPLPAWLTDRAARYTLPNQRRAPPSLAALAGTYANGGTDPAPARAALEDGTLVVHPCAGRTTEAAVGAALEDLRRRRVALDHVAVLSLVGRSASAVVGRRTVGGVAAIRADEPPRRDAVVVDTFLRFEGLERPVVVLCEGEHRAARRNYAQRMYMALTRAALQAVVVAAPDLALRDPVLGPLVEDAPGGPRPS